MTIAWARCGGCSCARAELTVSISVEVGDGRAWWWMDARRGGGGRTRASRFATRRVEATEKSSLCPTSRSSAREISSAFSAPASPAPSSNPRTSADLGSSAPARPTVAVTEQNDSAARSRASGRRSLSVFCACFGFCEPFIEVLSLQSCRRRRCRRRHSGTDHRRPRRGR